MTVYSFPNIILPLVAGILVDKLGARICIITFTGILFIGQLIVAFGGLLDSEGFAHYWVMLSGRFIFALGGEQLFVSYSKLFFFFLIII
jgi:MFS family permease